MRKKTVVLGLFLALMAWLMPGQLALACGGLFCQNSPVDQNAERIIFVDNGDGTTSAIVQIQYTGFDDDFSWILPIPEPIPAEAIEVPETAVAAFTELETTTNPIFIPPIMPECAMVVFDMEEAVPASAVEGEGGVNVYSSGEVGPYGFDVIGSEDQNALVSWLKEHNYRVTPEMEPLINVYIQEKFYFLAMRLLPEEGVQDIQPVQITYHTAKPMIPLRLTAVAANPDMAVLVWFFANSQAVPSNYAHMVVPDDELTFYTFGGNNYRQLMGDTANRTNGQAFVTEYAAPANSIPFSDPLLKELSQKHHYLTRLNTVLSPEEMTVDPVFDYDASLADVSNVHDLSKMTGLYDCEKTGDTTQQTSNNTASNNTTGNLPEVNNNTNGNTPTAESTSSSGSPITIIFVIVGAMVLLGAGVVIGRRGAK